MICTRNSSSHYLMASGVFDLSHSSIESFLSLMFPIEALVGLSASKYANFKCFQLQKRNLNEAIKVDWPFWTGCTFPILFISGLALFKRITSLSQDGLSVAFLSKPHDKDEWQRWTGRSRLIPMYPTRRFRIRPFKRVFSECNSNLIRVGIAAMFLELYSWRVWGVM